MNERRIMKGKAGQDKGVRTIIQRNFQSKLMSILFLLFSICPFSSSLSEKSLSAAVPYRQNEDQDLTVNAQMQTLPHFDLDSQNVLKSNSTSSRSPPPHRLPQGFHNSHVKKDKKSGKLNVGQRIGLLFAAFATFLQVLILTYLLIKRKRMLELVEKYEDWTPDYYHQ